ncbi:MAG: ABC transporter ATP-binding protein [Planctomycetota bacterium]|nr:MAG: ABC transporter ATP-binding protein [Planctomycetota bacterium]
MNESPVLQANGLSKSFADKEVIHSLSLEVLPGEIVGFIGPNGAGKSTSLRCLLGLNFPETGEVRIAGIDALRHPVRARSQVGYLPGETSLYKQMRGQEALDFGLAFHRKIQQAIVEDSLASWQLPLQRKIHTYSAGMKQQLALVIALGPDVPLYLLDEPEKALDPSHRRKLRSILLGLKARGKALLLSSHHLSELEELADRVIFLRSGLIIPDEEIEQARAQIALYARARFHEPPAPERLKDFEYEIDGRQWSFLPKPGEDPSSLATRLRKLGASSVKVGDPSLEEIYERLYVLELQS